MSAPTTTSPAVEAPKYKVKFATADQVSLVHKVIEHLATEYGFDPVAAWSLFDKLSFEKRHRRTKREGRKKNLFKPKSALTAYNYFTMDNRKRLHTEHPEMSFHDLSKHIGDMWMSLPKDEKDKYEAKHVADKVRYNAEKLAMQEAMTKDAAAAATTESAGSSAAADVSSTDSTPKPARVKKAKEAKPVVEATAEPTVEVAKPAKSSKSSKSSKTSDVATSASEPVSEPVKVEEAPVKSEKPAKSEKVKSSKPKAVEAATVPVKTVDDVKTEKAVKKVKKTAAPASTA